MCSCSYVDLVSVLFYVGFVLVFLLMLCVGLLLVFLFYDSGFASCVLVL